MLFCNVPCFYRLFVLPQYCGVLLEQCLLLNRRRNDMEETTKQRHHKPETVIEETLSTAGARDAAIITCKQPQTLAKFVKRRY